MVEIEHPHCPGGIGLTCKWAHLPLKPQSLSLKIQTYLEIITETERGWWLILQWWPFESLLPTHLYTQCLYTEIGPQPAQTSVFSCWDLEASPVIGSDGHNHVCVSGKVADAACTAEILFLVSAWALPETALPSKSIHVGILKAWALIFYVIWCSILSLVPNPLVLCYFSDVHLHSQHKRLMLAESCR